MRDSRMRAPAACCTQLVELSQPLTPNMALIYEAIAELMDVCVKELRRHNKLDTTELTLEQGLFRSFDEIVRRQLQSIWHMVSPRTKQARASVVGVSVGEERHTPRQGENEDTSVPAGGPAVVLATCLCACL